MNRGVALFQRGQGPRLVVPHEPAVADHVGRENGGEPPLHAFLGHFGTSQCLGAS
jgi:hypothetical protein